MRMIRMEPPARLPGRPALEPTTSIAEEFQPLFDARAAELNTPRPETPRERQTRLAGLFAADVTPLLEQTTTPPAPRADNFTTDDLDTLLNG